MTTKKDHRSLSLGCQHCVWLLATDRQSSLSVGIVGDSVLLHRQQRGSRNSQTFLRNNERLKQDIGEVKDFGSFVTGNVNIKNGDGNATINLKVIGERKTVNASVDLIYRNGQPWRVIAASYEMTRAKPSNCSTLIEAQKLSFHKLAA